MIPSSGKHKYKFGLKRSKISEDEKVGFFRYEKVELPEKFSLADVYPIEIYNQKDTNSCSANAICNQIKLTYNDLKLDPSRAFIYFNSLLRDHQKEGSTINISDSGCSLKSAYESLAQYKFCDEKLHPFDDKNITRFPKREAYVEASRINFIKEYRYLVPNHYNFCYILSVLKKPIVVGAVIFENFLALSKYDDILDVPLMGDEMLGLHAMLIIAYDDVNKLFTIVNSHGSEFGVSGKFRMTYDYVFDPHLCFEFFVLS